MIKIRKISDISELTVPQNGYVTMYVDKDEKFKAVITDVVNPKIQTLSIEHQEEEDYLRPINCILVDKKKLISISKASKKVGYRAFCLTEFSIFEWNGESWIESPLKNKTAIAQYLEINNSVIIWNNNKYYISLSTSDHVTNYRNPHKVTKEDVGLGDVLNEKQVDPEQWDVHVKNTNNPHKVTKEDVGLGDVLNVKSASEDQWISHTKNLNNPHKVTKEDVGLGNIENVHHVSQRDLDEHTHDMDAILEDLGLGNIKNITQADYTAVDRHVRDYNNPHGIRKEDIGLDQVLNVRQYEKSQFLNHTSDTNNPHHITKEDIGLGNVLENEQLISQEEFNTHKNSHNPHQVTKEDIGLGNVLNIPSVTVTDYESHLTVKNPHGITKEDIGLSKVENIILVPLTEYDNHVSDSNPHQVTKEQLGLGNVENVRQLLKNEYDNHVSDSNPHQVTKEQLGLSLVKNVKSASKLEVTDHVGRVDNPHRLTKEQIELGNVENIADIDYPLADTHRALLNNYVVKDDTNSSLGILKDYREDHPDKKDDFKQTIFPIISMLDLIKKEFVNINPTLKYTNISRLISFASNKHGCIGERIIGNDIGSSIEYQLTAGKLVFNDFVPIHESMADYGVNTTLLPPITQQRASRVQDSLKKLFLDNTEQKSNFDHYRIGSFDSESGMSYTYDTKDSAHMVLLDQYNDKLTYYHNNPLNTFCDPTKILFTQEGNIIGVPRINSKFLLLVDVNKANHDKYKYISFDHYGRITDCCIQIVKDQPTLNRIVTVERNDDYNRYVIKSLLINHVNIHAEVPDGGLTNIMTIYTPEILKFYVSSEGIQYVIDGKCMNYSFNTGQIVEFAYGNDEKCTNVNEFYQYGDYYLVLRSNYKELLIFKKETSGIRKITKYSLQQNYGINEISQINNLFKIVTENYIFVIKNENWDNPNIIYRAGSHHMGNEFAMLTYNTAFDTSENNLCKTTNQDPFTRVIQEKLFDSYDATSSLERNINVRSFRYSETSIDISVTDVVCMLNKKIMQLAIIHQEIDPDKINDPIKFEKYNNQEYIGGGNVALTYYHNDRLITIGHSWNYNEAVVVSNSSQPLNLDDSMFDKFICREKDKKETCQTLPNQNTMLDEYDFRLISDLPVKNIQKVVTVDYTGSMNSYGKYLPISVKNGMLILYDGGKLGYYDWNLNSLIEKVKTETENGDSYLLYNEKYFFPYIKDEEVTDIQSDFGSTVVTKGTSGKDHKLYKSYEINYISTNHSMATNSKILGKLYSNVSILCGNILRENKMLQYGLSKECNYLQYLKGGVYDFNKMKKFNRVQGNFDFDIDIDFVIPSVQSKDKLVAIKEVLNGYLLLQIGGEVEVTYNKWMVDFGMATAIPESVFRKPTFDYRG